MDALFTIEFMPIWGILALALLVAGAILFAVDPELAEVYVGEPPWMIAGLVAVVLLAVTTSANGPGFAQTVTALLQ